MCLGYVQRTAPMSERKEGRKKTLSRGRKKKNVNKRCATPLLSRSNNVYINYSEVKKKTPGKKNICVDLIMMKVVDNITQCNRDMAERAGEKKNKSNRSHIS